MELSEAGKFFLVEAQATIDQAQRAIEVAKRAGRGELGEIRIGMSVPRCIQVCLARASQLCLIY